MRKAMDVDVKVGVFVITGVILVMGAILMLGENTSLFTRHNRYTIHAPNVEGLISGAKVMLSGLQVGTVDVLEIDPGTKDVAVKITVNHKFGEWIRQDSTAEISTLGVLGDKYVRVTQGSPESPPIASGGGIPYSSTKDLSQFISKGDQLLVSLNSIAGSMDRLLKSLEKGNRGDTIFGGLASTSKNLAEVTGKLNQDLEHMKLSALVHNLNMILEKINSGKGTIGALVNDPALYDDAKSLVGGANRNRIIRNLVRQTIKTNEEAEAKAAGKGK